ncbi:hypothetical protein PshuTeo2_09920 [Pseudomonas hunanensis]|uniref:hypothetical protein n=1 Tax=Pseudomonas hunanensis TaxID=1247546 RepID=UPI002AA0DB8C|nr:hypothetical protein [Pseudomonas hunanensis]MDY7070951.1 hypothetical protein [Pseudomonas hunanensis]HDS0957248.1 hypothetical protein [Pseudomonas putida]
MNSKDPFNNSSLKADEALEAKKRERLEERDQKLIELKKEQDLRRDDDMEKAKQKILREHNRLDCKPSYARRKPLTAKQLEEQARRAVEASNLKESNLIREHYKHKVMSLENTNQHHNGEQNIDQGRSPGKITGIFNDLPKDKDGNELER